MHVSDKTVRNRFHEGGIRVQHPIVQSRAVQLIEIQFRFRPPAIMKIQ